MGKEQSPMAYHKFVIVCISLSSRSKGSSGCEQWEFLHIPAAESSVCTSVLGLVMTCTNSIKFHRIHKTPAFYNHNICAEGLDSACQQSTAQRKWRRVAHSHRLQSGSWSLFPGLGAQDLFSVQQKRQPVLAFIDHWEWM